MFLQYISTLWSYICVSAPFLLMGLIVAGLIHAFIPDDFLKRNLGGKGIFSVIKAAVIGIPLPLCSCGVIPTAVTLKKSGASNASTSSFLIATPESGIDSIAMTYAMMDFPMTIIRPIAAFLSAFIAGVMQFIFNPDTETQKVEEEKKSCCKKTQKKKKGVGEALRYGLFELLEDMSAWLTFGLILGALITFFVPDNFFSQLEGWQTRFLSLAVGIPLYICASATTPIAAGLILKGMTPGSALIILLVGPATNISNIAVLQKYIGMKGVMINVTVIAVVALIMSYVTDLLYSSFSWELSMNISEHMGHEQLSVFQQVLGVIFIVLLLKALFKEEILPRIKK